MEPILDGYRLLQCVQQRVTRKPEVQKLDLHSILYWGRVLDWNVGTQLVQTKEDRVGRNEEVIRLKLGTASVTTLHPREQGSVGVSTRWLQSAQQFRKEGYQVLGLQETRVRRSAQFRYELLLVWVAAAEAGRSGVEVWLDESLGKRIPGVSQYRFPWLVGGLFCLGTWSCCGCR